MPTISDDYLIQQQKLHADSKGYGSASLGYAPLIADIMEMTGFRSICDYGAGKQRLKIALQPIIKKFDYFPFDPAFPEYGDARPAELVVCLDVLEHIEPEYLDEVIGQLKRLTTHVALFSIHTGAAHKTLADGRNAHLIQRPSSWWLEKLLPHFDIIQLTPVKRGFWIIVQHKEASHARLFVRKPDHTTLCGKIKRWARRLLKRP